MARLNLGPNNLVIFSLALIKSLEFFKDDPKVGLGKYGVDNGGNPRWKIKGTDDVPFSFRDDF